MPHTHSHSGPSLFSALLHHPRNTRIEHQEANETILLLVRRHFFTNLPWIFTTVLLLLLPPFLTALSQQFSISLFLPPQFLLILLLFFYLAVIGYAFVNLFSWFYNLGILTTLRMVDVDAPSILSQSVSSAYLNEMVDVSYAQKGIIQSFLNFGDVTIQTEAVQANFEFDSVPQPAKVVDIILDAKAGRDTND